MKLYLASSFAKKSSVLNVYAEVTAAGHIVPDVWWNIDAKNDPSPDIVWYSKPYVQAIAARHFATIAECDAVILVSDDTPHKFVGANIEIGYAIGRGIPVYSVGAIERSAMYGPLIRCEYIDQLLEALAIHGGAQR